MSGVKKIEINEATKNKVKTEFTNGYWSFEDGFHQFKKYCILKNLRPKTIKGYEENYSRFQKYIIEETECDCIGSLHISDIENYIIYLRDTGMRETSVNTYLRSLRAILNFYNEQNACNRFKIPIYKADKKIKETYSDNELLKLLRKPNLSRCSFTEYRNWVIINFFLATGVRVSTLVNIKILDLDFDFERIHLVYTKSRKSYIIPMSRNLKEILKEYLSIRKGNEDDYLFCNQYGDATTTDSIKHAISKYNKARGVKRTGLHAFRHTFAKKCVLNDVNVFVLQRLLGHTDISITKEYVDLYANDLSKNIEKYNPLDTFDMSLKKQNNIKTTSKKKKITMN